MTEVALWRRLAAEFCGSALLAAVVIGSGIAAANLSPGDAGLELMENAAATAAGLFAIILMFGPVSGGHFNPVVSFADAAIGGLRWRDAAAYLPVQVTGCVAGAVAANEMFARAAVSLSAKDRATGPHFLAEIIATAGLVLVIFALVRSGRSGTTPAAVGAYIGAANFFTSSTSFANPAITVGRMFSATFAGIAPSSAPAFIAAQVIGGGGAVLVIMTLYPRPTQTQAQTQAQAKGPASRGQADAQAPTQSHARAGTGVIAVTGEPRSEGLAASHGNPTVGSSQNPTS